MTGQIILHIGAPKCGSTYIQRVFLQNHQHLKDHAIYYPHTNHSHPGNGANLREITMPWVARFTENEGTLLLSHEDLFSNPKSASRLKTIADKMGTPITVVVFLRPLNELLYADFSQNLKQTFASAEGRKSYLQGRNFKQFCRSRWHKIKITQYLNDWKTALPHARLVVCASTEIKHVFCQLNTGFDAIDWVVPKWRSNPSIPFHHCVKISKLLRNDQFAQARKVLTEPQTQSHVSQARPNYDHWINRLFETEIRSIKKNYGLNIAAAAR